MRYPTDKSSDKFRANLVRNSVALEFGLDPNDKIYAGKRGSPHVVLSRQIAIYLLHTVFNINLTRAAKAFRRHRATAQHACDTIEVLREDPMLDARISALEFFLKQAPVPQDCR
mgnify:CR=1 FL=1